MRRGRKARQRAAKRARLPDGELDLLSGERDSRCAFRNTKHDGNTTPSGEQHSEDVLLVERRRHPLSGDAAHDVFADCTDNRVLYKRTDYIDMPTNKATMNNRVTSNRDADPDESVAVCNEDRSAETPACSMSINTIPHQSNFVLLISDSEPEP